MTELKTLKDLMFEIGDSSIGDFFMLHNIPTGEAADICAKIQLKLKAEAVKWIKEMKEKGGYHEQVFWWIKTFFNIKKETESLQDTFGEIQESKIKRAIEWAEKMSKEASKEFQHDVYEKVLDYWLYFGEVRRE